MKKYPAYLMILVLIVTFIFSGCGKTAGGEETASSSQTQLTADDIDEMNDGNALMVFSDEGYLTTLIGTYYDKKIEDYEDAMDSLEGVAALVGLGGGSQFYCVYGSRNTAGYTVYTFQQKYGDTTIKNATLKVMVDPDGYTAGLSSSITPNVGIPEDSEAISKEEAEAVVRERFAAYDLTYYTDYTERLAVTFSNVTYNCWAVYTNNPDMTVSFDMAYLEHYVMTDGTYLTLVPTASLATSTEDSFKTDDYFTDLTPETYTREITRPDGKVVEVSVTVSKNKNDGLYYLADPERKIMTAWYYDFNYLNTLNFLTAEKPDDFDDNHLFTYYNYSQVYDFFASYGMKSVDGFGTPILVTVGFCDSEGNAIDNACYYGNNMGWACFGASDVNYYGYALDAMAHEYTHGISRQTMQGSAYYNEYGSINESFSDILGNLCEMSCGATDDTGWLIGEATGSAIRNMGNPNDYAQPSFVGDVYYVPNVITPNSSANDNGGVHTNNSLIAQIAYKLDKAGMSYDDQVKIWLNAIEMMTPLSDYDDLHACLLWALKTNGLADYGTTVNTAYEEEGLNGDRAATYLEAERNFCGRIQFNVDETLAAGTHFVIYTDTNGTRTLGYPDENGVVSNLLPTGSYTAAFCYVEGTSYTAYYYTSDGWRAGGDPVYIPVESGKTVELNSLSYEGGSESSGQSTETETTASGLKLITVQGDGFSLIMPEGWRVETGGSGSDFWFSIFNPENPSMRCFYYGTLTPFLKSEAARNMYKLTDNTGIFKNAPVLQALTSEALLLIWSDCIEYQTLLGANTFVPLYDIDPIQTEYVTGMYSAYGLVESVTVANCSTDYDDDVMIMLQTAFTQDSSYIDGVDIQPVAAYGTMAVMARTDEIDDVYEDLLTCLGSLTFDEGNSLTGSGLTDDSSGITGGTELESPSGVDTSGMEDFYQSGF